MKKPSLAALIVEKVAARDKDKPESEEDNGALEAMEAFISAVKDGDAEAALEEFNNLCTLCQEEE